MTRDMEIKLKVATIIDEAVGEKGKTRRRLTAWPGFVWLAIRIATIVIGFLS